MSFKRSLQVKSIEVIVRAYLNPSCQINRSKKIGCNADWEVELNVALATIY